MPTLEEAKEAARRRLTPILDALGVLFTPRIEDAGDEGGAEALAQVAACLGFAQLSLSRMPPDGPVSQIVDELAKEAQRIHADLMSKRAKA
jgi:hypothetical protein